MMSSEELTLWLAYYKINPFGEERDDLRAGIIASTVYGCMAGKSSSRLTPQDFMPKFGPRKYDPKLLAQKLKIFKVGIKNVNQYRSIKPKTRRRHNRHDEETTSSGESDQKIS